MTIRVIAILSCTFLFSCSAVEQHANVPAPTPTPTAYSCTDYGKYDDELSCNTATQARCTVEWQTFPSGGLQPCYVTVPGGENCLVIQITNPPQWVYSPGIAWCRTTAGSYTYSPSSGFPFIRLRSLVGCSDQTTCLCLSPSNIEGSETCTSAIDCAGFSNPPTGSEACCLSASGCI